jgi:CubicO group peptidase (beta-lactamase class C family)
VSDQCPKSIVHLLCNSRAALPSIFGLFVVAFALGMHMPASQIAAPEVLRQLFAPDVIKTLNSQLESIMKEDNLPSVEVGVLVPGKGEYSFIGGTANLATRIPRKRNEPFRIASITKPFAATAILVLIDRGRLHKTDTISKWYPDFPYANIITIDDLLRMRSGIPAPSDDEVLARVYDRPLAPAPPFDQEMASYAALQSEFVTPNTKGVYTDFNYDILAAIAQKVTGEDIGSLITETVIEPLHLSHTSYPIDIRVPSKLRGYGWNPSTKVFEDKTLFNPPLGGAAGAVISNAEDLHTFSRALCTGKLLSPSTFKAQMQGKPLEGTNAIYGEGVAVGPGVCGHSGTINGYTSDMYYFTSLDASLVVNVNRLDRDNKLQSLAIYDAVSKVILSELTPEEPVSGDLITPHKIRLALPKIDNFTEKTLAETGVPGLAMGIVYKDEVIYLRGFGVREAGKWEPVDADTVFQLASVSKPISSTVVSSLVSDGVVSWDDPVIKYDPAFRMHDPYVTSHVTIADFFAHRSGLWGNAGNDLEWIGYERATILRRLHLLKPAGPFRATYAYSNFGLTEGAVAAAKAAGKSWEDLAFEKLYEPLGMTSTSSRYADFLTRENRAHLHVPLDGQWTPLVMRDADAQSPAGGVSSSVRDLMQWVRLELANGAINGKQLISKEALDAAHQPTILRGTNPDTGAPAFYGYAWTVDYDSQGRLLLGHAGAFARGARTFVTLLPQEQLGIVVLTNAFPTGVPEGIAYTCIDFARSRRTNKDWVTIWNKRYEEGVKDEKEAEEKYAHPPSPAYPPQPFPAYTGKYRNSYFGTVEIMEADGELRLLLGPKRKPFTLEHWDCNTFLYHPFEEAPAFPSPLTFSIGPDGKASGVIIDALNDDGQGTLTRVANH